MYIFFYWLSYVIIIWICKIQINRWLLVWAINLWKLVRLIYTHKIEEILRPYFTFFLNFHMGILQSLPSHSSITTVWKWDLYVLIWEDEYRLIEYYSLKSSCLCYVFWMFSPLLLSTVGIWYESGNRECVWNRKWCGTDSNIPHWSALGSDLAVVSRSSSDPQRLLLLGFYMENCEHKQETAASLSMRKKR